MFLKWSLKYKSCCMVKYKKFFFKKLKCSLSVEVWLFQNEHVRCSKNNVPVRSIKMCSTQHYMILCSIRTDFGRTLSIRIVTWYWYSWYQLWSKSCRFWWFQRIIYWYLQYSNRKMGKSIENRIHRRKIHFCIPYVLEIRYSIIYVM